jgi:hypothetical protein
MKMLDLRRWKLWTLHATTDATFGLSARLAEIINRDPPKYWTPWGARYSARFLMEQLELPVRLTVVRVK